MKKLKSHTKKLTNKSSLSKRHLSLFILMFAVIGGIFLIRSFAANPNLPGDVNNDNIVNITDLSILLSSYGTTNTNADLNSDGTVNVLDMSILLSNYGRTYTGSLPRNLTPPTISGQATVGSTLTVTGDTWSNASQVSYQWFYENADGSGDVQINTSVPGSTGIGNTYKPVTYDVGGRNYVVATAQNSSGTVSVTSAPTAVITNPSTPPPPPPPSSAFPPAYAQWSDDFTPAPDSRWSWEMQGPTSFPHQGAFTVDDGEGGKAVRLKSPVIGGNGALSAFYDGSGQWGKQGDHQLGQVEFKLVNQNAFIWFWEWHESDGVEGPNSCAIGLNPNRTIKIQVSGGNPSGHQYTIRDDSQVLQLNRWYKLEWDIVWSTGSNGRFSVKLDGRSLVDIQRPTLLVRPNGQPDNVVIGGYSYTPPGSSGEQSIDFRRFAVGLQ